MTFSDYNLVKAQYDAVEHYNDLQLCLCADKKQTDHVWQAPLSIKTDNKNRATESFYIFMIPKGLNFTEEKYELFKFFFERYVKSEKVKEKLEKIKKDFV